MEKIDTTTKTLMPVFNRTGCVGHVLRTAKGFRTCDVNDKEIGIYQSPDLGIAALLIGLQTRLERNLQIVASRVAKSAFSSSSLKIRCQLSD